MEIKETLRQFIVENFMFGQQDADFADEDSFLEKGIIDSTGVLELVMFLEEKFGIKVEEEDLIPDNLDSLSKVADFVGKKVRQLEAGKAAAG